LADLGERPEGTTLDRIDNERGDEPGDVLYAQGAESDLPRNGTSHRLVVQARGVRGAEQTARVM
jgi:hypothetical protein